MILSEIIKNELPLEKILRSKKVSYEELLKMLAIDSARPALPDTLPRALQEVITRAWDTDPAARPSADEMLSALELCTSVLDGEVV